MKAKLLILFLTMLPGLLPAAVTPSLLAVHSSEYGNGFFGSSVYSNGLMGVSVLGPGVYGYSYNGYGGYFESRDGMALKAVQDGQSAAADVWAAKVWRRPLAVDNRAAVMFVASSYDYQTYQGGTPFCFLLHLADVPPGYTLAAPKAEFRFVSDTDPSRDGAFVQAATWDRSAGFQASILSLPGRSLFMRQTTTAAEIRATQTAITVQADNGGPGQVVTFDKDTATFPSLTVTTLIYGGPTAAAPVDAVNQFGWIKFFLPDGSAVFMKAYK